MDHDAGTQKESIWEKLLFSLVFFLAMALPVVGIVMFWIFDAPTWAIGLASVLLAVFACLVGFSDLDEEEEESAPEPEERVEYRWKFDRPVGLKGWLWSLGQLYLGWAGLCIVFNKVILEWLLDASVTALAISTVILLFVAIALEYLDTEEVEGSGSEATSEHPDERPGLVDA